MKPFTNCKTVFVILITLRCFVGSAFAQTEDVSVDSALARLPDVKIVSKSVHFEPYKLEYQLTIRQPVSHTDSTRGFFYQRLHLIHRGFSKPMVMETEGYTGRAQGDELEEILASNDLNVEFRYFNRSKPDSLQWEYLTFQEATADLHHINQIFHSLYPGTWISTGISRGGQTSLIYRCFYPDDVKATVAYVAPVTNDIEDKRIYSFLDTAGGPKVVKKLRDFQVFLLQHEKEVIDRLPIAAKQLHYTAAGGIGASVEYLILEYPFSFWQISDYDPKDIPVDHDINHYYNHLMDVLGGYAGLFSDEGGVQPYLPHAYMTYQTGYYGYRLAPFKPYLHYLHGKNPSAALLPQDLPRKPYDPSVEKKLIDWIASEGNNVLYIYGGRDTWSACAPELGTATNAKKFVIPGANHFEARIRGMAPAQQQDFISALEKMTGLTANVSALKSF